MNKELKGYCSDCYIFNKCPWFCNRYDPVEEQPYDGNCWSKEVVPKGEDNDDNKV